MKKNVLSGSGFLVLCICLGLVFSSAIAYAQIRGGSAKPRMIEVEEAAWIKLNQDLLKMQDELIRSQTETKMAQAELERERYRAAQLGAKGAKMPVHRVQKKESLWKIARKYYNDPFKWRWIFKANIRQITDPNKIYPETILDIPRY